MPLTGIPPETSVWNAQALCKYSDFLFQRFFLPNPGTNNKISSHSPTGKRGMPDDSSSPLPSLWKSRKIITVLHPCGFVAGMLLLKTLPKFEFSFRQHFFFEEWIVYNFFYQCWALSVMWPIVYWWQSQGCKWQNFFGGGGEMRKNVLNDPFSDCRCFVHVFGLVAINFNLIYRECVK